MTKRYQIITRMGIAGALGLAAFFIPALALKLLISLVAVIVLSLCLKRFAWVPIVFFILFIMLPVGFFSFARIGMPHEQWFFDFFNFRFGPGYSYYGPYRGWSYSPEISGSSRLMPDTTISGAENLVLNGLGFEIEFVPGISGIKLPSGLQTRHDGKVLTISMPDSWQNTTAVVQVGVDSRISSLTVRSAFLKLHGRLETETVTLNTTAFQLSGDIVASDSIRISGAAAELSGTLSAKQVLFDGITTISARGRIKAETILLNGSAAATLNLELEGVKEFRIVSSVVNADLKYLDTWHGARALVIEAMAGDVRLSIPTENPGIVDVTHSGFIKLTTDKY